MAELSRHSAFLYKRVGWGSGRWEDRERKEWQMELCKSDNNPIQSKAPPPPPPQSFSLLSAPPSLTVLQQIRSIECQSSAASCHTAIVCVCVGVCMNVQSNATLLHTFNAGVFGGTIQEELGNEVEEMQRTGGRGGGEGTWGAEKETKETRTWGEQDTKQPRGKRWGVRRTCATTVKLSHFYLVRGLPKWSAQPNYFPLIKATYAKTIKSLIGHLFIKEKQ